MTTEHSWSEDAIRGLYAAEEAGFLGDLTLSDWEALPEELCRDHELSGGRLVKRESGTAGHQIASRRLANALEAAARRSVDRGTHKCLTVNQDLDVRLWEVPATVRRPDVLIYQCVDPGVRVWADDVLLLVEIVSPGSVADDTGVDDYRSGFVSKKTQYALAGIETYVVVFLRPDDSAIHRIQQWQLVAGLNEYRLVNETVNQIDEYALSLRLPFDADIPYADLAF